MQYDGNVNLPQVNVSRANFSRAQGPYKVLLSNPTLNKTKQNKHKQQTKTT